MSQTTALRAHLFHDTRLLATIHGATARPQPYYTLEDGTVVQAISYLTVTHTDGTSGVDVQVVPVGSGDSAPPRADRARAERTWFRA